MKSDFLLLTAAVGGASQLPTTSPLPPICRWSSSAGTFPAPWESSGSAAHLSILEPQVLLKDVLPNTRPRMPGSTALLRFRHQRRGGSLPAPSLTEAPAATSGTRSQYKHRLSGASSLVPKATRICTAPPHPTPDSANGWEVQFLQNHLEIWLAPQETRPWSKESKGVSEATM